MTNRTKRVDVGNEYIEWLKWQGRWKYVGEEQKTEVLGAQNELKSRKPFASLLSIERLGVFESGIEVCRFILSTLVKESEGF